MKLWQVILYPILVMLMVLGCFTVYQREETMLKNQSLLAAEIVTVKNDRDAVNRQIEGYLKGFDARLSGLESLAQSSPKKN